MELPECWWEGRLVFITSPSHHPESVPMKGVPVGPGEELRMGGGQRDACD